MLTRSSQEWARHNLTRVKILFFATEKRLKKSTKYNLPVADTVVETVAAVAFALAWTPAPSDSDGVYCSFLCDLKKDVKIWSSKLNLWLGHASLLVHYSDYKLICGDFETRYDFAANFKNYKLK